MYVEADLLYSLIKPEDWLKPLSERFFKKTKQKLCTSSITVTEIEIVARREVGIDFSDRILEAIKLSVKNIEILPLTEKVLTRAVNIRKAHGLNIFDSIHAATCLENKEVIVSTDHVFDVVKGLKRIDPRKLVKEN